MKRLLILICVSVFFVTSCKKSDNHVKPIEEDQFQEEEEIDDGSFIFYGQRFDNERVSIPDAQDVNIKNSLFISRIDTTFVADSVQQNLTWTVLVPENESVKAEWTFELDSPLLKTEKKYWYPEEKIWKYVFSVNLANPDITGSGRLLVSLINEATGEVISRDYNVTVELDVVKTDINSVSFGMSKEEVKALELARASYEKPYARMEWGEYLPNFAYIAFTAKWLNGGISTYEFKDDKLFRVTEFDYYTYLGWYTNPTLVESILRNLKIKEVPELPIDPETRGLKLEKPISWIYNGLRITVDPAREYHIDGEPKKMFAIVFEPAE